MELSKEELGNMVEAFRKAGLNPKSDTPEEFKHWVQGLSQQDIAPVIKKEPEGENPEPDMKSSTVTYHNFPKLPFFSGEPGKDAEYDLWRYEVNCLLDTQTYSKGTILQAIRRSLKGEAALAVMKVGPKATITDILSKLKSAFGTLRRSSVLMSKFYSSCQGESEDVSAWSCRLERLLYQLAEQKSIPPAEQDEMLRTRLWDGLNPSLKSLAGYKYESITNFDDLRLCLREMEFDLQRITADAPKVKAKQATAHTAKASVTDSSGQDLSEIKSMFKEMYSEFADMKERQQHMTAQIQQLQPSPFVNYSHQGPAVTSFRGGYNRHRDRGQYKQGNEGWSDTIPGKVSSAPSVVPQQTTSHSPSTPSPGQTSSQSQEPVCWRCGYSGHLAYGCRVRLDHRRKPLNWNRPMGRGDYQA
ncbi:uncharacterized protein LOC125372482 [Haliotis rufescens]|uniref:uncharacterized protein LOC125372482 n=1 Tax=Haliotis rufescens TaxID=6454 RepID=UPI00201F7070|nr:uncharacterized protein LOC125372482 [Haliotis rufescens]